MSSGSIGIRIVVQLACRGWAGLLTLALAPVYIRFLGTESYGVIGTYATIQALLTVFDFGFGIALSRELARLPESEEGARDARDWVRTLEWASWVIAAAVGALLIALVPALGEHWLQPQNLTPTELESALLYAAIALAAQWPSSLYLNGLHGRQRQIEAGASLALAATIRGAGSVAVLAFVDARLTTFFIFQAIVAMAYTFANRALLLRALPAASLAPTLRPSLVKDAWRFAAGVMGLSIVSLLITQADKILLSRLLPLDAFGAYAFAATAAAGITMISTPVFGVLMPRFAQLSAAGRTSELAQLYHLSTQFLAAALFPLALTAALFADTIFEIWTGNPVLVEGGAGPFALLVLGNAVNGVMVIPFTLKLALRLSGLPLRLAAFLLLILVPATALFTVRVGPIGAAGVWLAVNLVYVVIGSRALHARALHRELREWLLLDVGRIAVASASIVLPAAIFLGNRALGPFPLLFVWLGASAAALLSARRAYSWVKAQTRFLGSFP